MVGRGIENDGVTGRAWCETTDVVARIRRFSPDLTDDEVGEIAGLLERPAQ